MRFDLLFCNLSTGDSRKQACSSLRAFQSVWPEEPAHSGPPHRVYGFLTERPVEDTGVLVCVMYVKPHDPTTEWIADKSTGNNAGREQFIRSLVSLLREASGTQKVRVENQHGQVLRLERWPEMA